MKKIWLSVLSLFTAATAFGGVAMLNANAAVEDVPETLTISNVAFGKEVTFRSLTDMNVEMNWGSYFPDAQGFYGANFNGDSLASLTDGNAEWGAAQNRSPQTSNTHAWALLDLGSAVSIEEIKVGYLASWCFKNVVIQVSNDATFTMDVTTIFASTDQVLADDGVTVIYNGGQVGCSEATRAETGWNGFVGVDSASGGLRTYDTNGVSARYVRLTNADDGNGGAFSVTTFTELQVYAPTSGVVAPTASVASGSYESITAVELTAGKNAEIYYTLDGTYPTKNSTKYEGPIDASAWNGAVALRTVAVVDGKQSEAADYVYKITTPSVNKAYGKEVAFRSLTDMNVDVAYGSYYPDAQGFYGDNFNGNSLTSLTDGESAWAAAQNRSPQTSGTHAWVFLDLGSEIEIDNIKVGYLAAWCFTNVVIQVSNDPTFTTDVTTVFAVTDTVYADDGVTVIYNGGQVGCSETTRAETGWNGFVGVDSLNGGLRTYTANGVSARYVRLTNSDGENGGAFNVTTFTEIQVFNVGGSNVAEPEIKDTVKSATVVNNAVEVEFGTDLDGVKALLPTSVSYTTMQGATGEVALTWESADWTDATAGTYTFTATPVLAVDDVFDIIPASYSVSVKVNEDENANKVRYVSISMAGDIGLNFYVSLADVTEATATLTMKGVETSVEGIYQENLECWKFTYGVAPKDYKEIVTISVVDVVAEYSVAAYANALPETNKAYPMVAELMEYCEAARVYFAGETATPTEDLTADLTEYKATISGEDENVTIAGTTLVLESKTTINVYFTASNVDALTCKVNGVAVTPIQTEGGQYVISISGVVSKDLDRVYTVQIGGYTITYCALSYVETTLAQGTDNVALANLVKALYELSVEAEEYFATVA